MPGILYLMDYKTYSKWLLIYVQQSMGEDSGIGNPLLESIHELWSPLHARLCSSGKGLVNAFNRQQCCNLSAESGTGRHMSILFSKVLQIIAKLSELSGGFMVDRF